MENHFSVTEGQSESTVTGNPSAEEHGEMGNSLSATAQRGVGRLKTQAARDYGGRELLSSALVIAWLES